MKRALLPITLATLLSVFIYSCSSDDDDSASPSVIQTPTPEPELQTTEYTLTVSAGEGGSVSTEGGTYDEGTQISVTANPSEGFGFGGWTNFESNSSNINITLNSNISITANFITLPSLSMVSSSTMIFTKSKKDTLTFETNIAGGFQKLEINSDNGDVEIVSQPDIGATSGEIKLTYNPQAVVNVDLFRTIAGYDDISISVFDSYQNYSSNDVRVKTQPEPIFNKDYLKTNRETSISRANRIDPNLIRHLNKKDNIASCESFNLDPTKENYNQGRSPTNYDVMRHFVMVDINQDGYDDLVLHPNYGAGASFTSIKMGIEIYFYENGDYIFKEVLNQNGVVPEAHLVTKFLIGDFDNDGKPDLYATNSGIDAPPYTMENSFFLYNDYNDKGYLTQIDNNFVNYGHNATSGDIDNDGDLDIFQNGRPHTDNRGLFDFVINQGGRNFTKGNLLSEFKIEGDRWRFFDGTYTSELRDVNMDGYLDLLLIGQANEDDDYESGYQSSWGKILFSDSSGNFKFENFKYIPNVTNFNLGLDFQFYDLDLDGNEEIFVLRSGDGRSGQTNGGSDVNENIHSTNYYSGYYIQIVKFNQNNELIDVTEQFMDGNGQSGIPTMCNNLSFFFLEIGDYDDNGSLDLFSLLAQHTNKKLVRWEFNGSKFVKRSPTGTDWMWD